MDQPEERCFFEPCPESQAGKPLSRSGRKRIVSIVNASKEVHGDGRHENWSDYLRMMRMYSFSAIDLVLLPTYQLNI